MRWVGDSLEQVRSFPEAVKKDIGSALFDIQMGARPPQAKPLKGISSGIWEIVTRFDTNTYRTVYAVKIGERVYVLHAFQKKSPRGSKTAKKDIETITRRYREALAIEKEDKS
ncbi:MAG: type II toxin-antitoxin system RelE/ParE family toxin [Nitrospina sp.]|nr:type II toxin-antitoxin system RelE/ParE family toxin [Nitrospina sp.]